MGTTENKRAITQACAELAEGNGEPFLALMADDFRWTIIGSTEWSGTYAGRDTVLEELLQPLFAQFADTYVNTPERLIAEGDHVVVQCRGSVSTRSGRRYDNTYCWVCRFADGKLVEMTEYLDTELLGSALDPPSPAADQG